MDLFSYIKNIFVRNSYTSPEYFNSDMPLIRKSPIDYYNEIPIVKQCVDKITNCCQHIPFQVIKDDTSTATLKQLNDLEKLLHSFQFIGTTANEFKRLVTKYLALYGFTPLMVSLDDKGNPTAIRIIHEPIIPVFKEGVFHPVIEKYIIGKNFELPSEETYLSGRRVKKYLMIVGKSLNNENDIYTSSPLYSLFYDLASLEILKKRLCENIQKNAGEKTFLIAGLIPNDYEKLKEIYSKPPYKDFTILQSGASNGVPIQQVKADFGSQHLEGIPIINDFKREVANSFQIPSSLLGIASQDGSRYTNNLSGLRQYFYEEVIIPKYLTPISDALSRCLANTKTKIIFNLTDVDFLNNKKADYMSVVSGLDVLTFNEKRQMLKLPLVEDELANSFHNLENLRGNRSELRKKQTN
jgi:hypothetical protein